MEDKKCLCDGCSRAWIRRTFSRKIYICMLPGHNSWAVVGTTKTCNLYVKKEEKKSVESVKNQGPKKR